MACAREIQVAVADRNRDNPAQAAHARALAAADFDTLVNRISDPVLRGWFVRQPLVARWLGRSGEPEESVP